MPVSRGSVVLELRQLDLQARLPRAGAAREDVEDQLGAVDDLGVQLLLEVAHLRGREVVVEDDEVGLALLRQRLQLGQLALAEEGGRVHLAAPLHQLAQHARPGGVGEPAQLVERAGQVRAVAPGVPDQHGPLRARRARHLVRARLHPRGSISRSAGNGVRFSIVPSGRT